MEKEDERRSMQYKLMLYIGLLLLGMLLSRLNLFGEKVYSSLGKLQTLCLIVLLTSMGINLGMNDEILKSLATIGLKGVVFGVVTVMASLLFVHLVVKVFFHKERSHD